MIVKNIFVSWVILRLRECLIVNFGFICFVESLKKVYLLVREKFYIIMLYIIFL